MIIIETCPRCGHDLHDVMLTSNPPIPQKECFNCGWSWTGEPEEVIRVPFGGNSMDLERLSLNDYNDITINSFEPSPCVECSNNPKNGGSGICNCTLPYMQNPTTYMASEDSCMVNNIGGNAYFVTSLSDLTTHKASPDRIAEAVERTQKYLKNKYIQLVCPECGAQLEVYYDGPHAGDPEGLLIRHCENCHRDWESEWHEDGSESELRRKFWG